MLKNKKIIGQWRKKTFPDGGGLQFFKDTELNFPAQNTFW